MRCDLRRRDHVAARSEIVCEEGPIVAQNLADVLAGFVDWRKGAVTIHYMLSCVIGCERQREISPKSIE